MAITIIIISITIRLITIREEIMLLLYANSCAMRAQVETCHWILLPDSNRNLWIVTLQCVRKGRDSDRERERDSEIRVMLKTLHDFEHPHGFPATPNFNIALMQGLKPRPVRMPNPAWPHGDATLKSRGCGAMDRTVRREICAMI